MGIWTQKITTKVTDFLIIQLFITLLSWPILLWWGLAITPLSIIGNAIFGPFLTLFLLLSSLITTCELIGVPNSLFIWLLEQTTSLWLKLITCNSYDFSITFAKPSILLALIAPLVAIGIMKTHLLKNPLKKLGGLCGAYVLLACLFSLQGTPDTLQIPYGNREITIKKIDKKIIMLDPGFGRRYASINTWINYTLLPELAKNFGIQVVDELILEKETPSAVRCAEVLRMKNIVRN